MSALGRGQFGHVTLCRLRLGLRDHLVAVKQLADGATDTDQAHFLVEARILAGLRHPSLLSLVGVCHDRLPFLMVTEFMPHGDLKVRLHTRGCRSSSRTHRGSSFLWSLLQQGYLRRCREGCEDPPQAVTPAHVVEVALQLVGALAYLERLSILHRDLAARCGGPRNSAVPS